MSNGGRLDVAQEWANHADPRTTGLYDHSTDKVSQEKVERIRFERDSEGVTIGFGGYWM